MRYELVSMLLIAGFVSSAFAKEKIQRSSDDQEPVKATYLITGLHCAACTQTIETSLRKAKGIRPINVDWKTKKARIEFDERLVPAQEVARLVADTPHFMGSEMHYGAWLMLKVAAIKDDATAKQIKAAVSRAAGVHHVIAYPAERTIAVQFPAKGEWTTKHLIDALRKVGVEAATF